MKNIYLVYSTLFICGVAVAAGGLFDEFKRRESLRLTQEQGNAINFLRLLNVDPARIEQLEVLGNGTFVYRDRDDIVCFGEPAEKMLRCKNKIGLTTVNYDGDAD